MFCRKLMEGRDEAEDLFQDAVMNAFTGYSTLREHASFRPWLYRIIVNTFKSTVRHPWWKRRANLDPAMTEPVTAVAPEDRLSARRWLTRAFAAISTEDQTLVTLYELEAWSIKELAELYGKSEGSLKARLFRARKRMRNRLAQFAPKSVAESEDTKPRKQEAEEWIVAKPETD